MVRGKFGRLKNTEKLLYTSGVWMRLRKECGDKGTKSGPRVKGMPSTFISTNCMDEERP